jgi:hypothetical protein
MAVVLITNTLALVHNIVFPSFDFTYVASRRSRRRPLEMAFARKSAFTDLCVNSRSRRLVIPLENLAGLHPVLVRFFICVWDIQHEHAEVQRTKSLCGLYNFHRRLHGKGILTTKRVRRIVALARGEPMHIAERLAKDVL